MFRCCGALFLAPFVFAQLPKSTHVYKTAGGSLDSWRRVDYGHRGQIRTAQLQRYLDAGLSVVSIDYRLAPETKLDAILSDLTDSWRWLRHESESLGIDPTASR